MVQKGGRGSRRDPQTMARTRLHEERKPKRNVNSSGCVGHCVGQRLRGSGSEQVSRGFQLCLRIQTRYWRDPDADAENKRKENSDQQCGCDKCPLVYHLTPSREARG